MLKFIKRIAANVASWLRKLWNFPSDAIFFIKCTFGTWIRSLKMIWSVAEMVEVPEVLWLSVVELVHSAKDSWKALSSRIQIRQKVRFQIQSSWIDKVIYEV